MMKLILYSIILYSFIGCKTQDKITGSYFDYQYSGTENTSYLRQELKFINKDKDTLKVNLRLPYDTISRNIINRGVFYNCILKKGTIYTITLKKICVKDIPETFNSYYKTNAIPDKTDCSKFREIKNNTAYEYKGDYGKYVDINNVIYEVIGLSPSDGCFFVH